MPQTLAFLGYKTEKIRLKIKTIKYLEHTAYNFDASCAQSLELLCKTRKRNRFWCGFL